MQLQLFPQENAGTEMQHPASVSATVDGDGMHIQVLGPIDLRYKCACENVVAPPCSTCLSSNNFGATMRFGEECKNLTKQERAMLAGTMHFFVQGSADRQGYHLACVCELDCTWRAECTVFYGNGCLQQPATLACTSSVYEMLDAGMRPGRSGSVLISTKRAEAWAKVVALRRR
jgi:hypothetical protein